MAKKAQKKPAAEITVANPAASVKEEKKPVAEKAKETAVKVAEKVGVVVEKAEKKAEEVATKAQEKVVEVVKKVEEKTAPVAEKIKEKKAEKAVKPVKPVKSEKAEKAEKAVKEAVKKVADAAEKAVDTVAKAAEKVAEKAEESKVAEKVAKVVKTAEAKVDKPVAAKAEKPAVPEEKKYRKKVLFVAAEALPYVKTGGLGDVAAALPKALLKEDYDVRVVLPLYFNIPDKFRTTMQYLGCCYVSLAWRYQYCGVFTQKYDGVTYYFIDNEYYFKRNGIYGHYDDAERFAFFSKAVLEALPIMDFTPDIIHCHDWHTGLTPVYLDVYYRNSPYCKSARTVFTIHNIQFQGKYGTEICDDILGLPADKKSLVLYQNCVNFMKGAIECSNKVTTVSPTYAEEILNSYYSFGLQDILGARKYKLSGIINGIDVDTNDPATDKALFKNYDKTTVADKAANKKGLQQMLNLDQNPNVPVIGMVTRLTEQKGMELIANVFEAILSKGVQMVVLGSGDWKYESLLKDMQKRFPDKLRAVLGFSGDLASKIYAGADIFLMPSKFEPCGLSQMISMRYGTIPIVRETGGLKDTVVPYNGATGEGTGFTFYSYNAHDMLYAIERAVGLYYDYKDDWKKLVQNAMSQDFSWNNICKQYIALYENL